MDKQKTIAYICTDLHKTTIGTQARIAKEIAGLPVLARTCQRLLRCKLLDGIIVFCPTSQKDEIAGLLIGLEVRIVGLDQPITNLPLTKHRKWALHSWRGGIDEATVFDELPISDEIIMYLRNIEAYGIVAIHAEAVFVDPDLTDKLIEHFYQKEQSSRFAFTQAPPGLCGVFYRLDMLHEINLMKLHIGQIMAYNPNSPRSDLIIDQCNYKVGPEIYTCNFRFIADTTRTFSILEKFFDDFPAADDLTCADLIDKIKPYYQAIHSLPYEINVAINNSVSQRAPGYPHNQLADKLIEMSQDTFISLLQGLDTYDDICLTLGVLGEPLAHQQLSLLLKTAKKSGIFGINIQTDGLLLDDKYCQLFLDNDIDVLTVFLDGHLDSDYETIKTQLLKIYQHYKQLPQHPLLIPALVKSRQTLGQMEEFFDYWLANADYATIEGYSDFAGQIENNAVMNMAPPKREPCRKLYQSITVLPDGTVTLCPLDYKGLQALGNINDMTIEQIWHSDKLNNIRQQHQNNTIKMPLCTKCNDWHRL